MLWYQVGPVATHSVVTATVEPTAEPTSFASPGELHPLVASNYGEQLAEAKLPANFVWGLSSSAYQSDTDSHSTLNRTDLGAGSRVLLRTRAVDHQFGIYSPTATQARWPTIRPEMCSPSTITSISKTLPG